MKFYFSKTFLFFSFLACLFFQKQLYAQEKDNQFKLGGLLFGDVYHISQHHLENEVGRTEAVLRRAYITFDAKIKKKWFARVRTETNQAGEFGVYAYETDVKDLFVGYKSGKHKFILGLSPTKTYDLIEGIWGMRYLMRTPMDLQGVASRDFGISIDGAIDQKNRFFYRFMIGAGQDFGNETGDGPKTMLGITYKTKHNYYFDVYVDYETIPGEKDRSTFQLFSGYKSENLRWGLQYSHQFRQEDPALELFSGFITQRIYKKIAAVGRIDRIMEPSPNGNNISYIPFDPTTKATMFVTGLEIPLTDYLLITPNIIFTTYDKPETMPKPNNDLMFRCTVFLNLE